MCMGAALAWLQHVHGGGTLHVVTNAYVQHVHGSSTCMVAAYA